MTAPAHPDSQGTREELAAAALPLMPHSVGCHAHGADCICVNRRAMRATQLADALLPVVERLCDQRAAEALESAAEMQPYARCVDKAILRALADARRVKP